MALTWKLVISLVASWSGFVSLLVGLLALAVYPIVGVLITIGAMALLLYSVAGLCGVKELKD